MFDGDLMIPISVRLEKRGFMKFLSIVNPIIWLVFCFVSVFRLTEWGSSFIQGTESISTFPFVTVILFVICSICNYMSIIEKFRVLNNINSDLSRDAKMFKLKFKENKNTLYKDSLIYGVMLLIILFFSMTAAVLLYIGVVGYGLASLGICFILTVCEMPLTAKLAKEKVELHKDTEAVYDLLYACPEYQEYLYRDFEMKLRTNNYESNC